MIQRYNIIIGNDNLIDVVTNKLQNFVSTLSENNNKNTNNATKSD